MAGGGKTATSTSQVKIPPEVLARYNAVNAQAQQVSQQPFHPYSMDPNAFVAPLTPTQQMGIYNTNVAAGMAQPYYEQAGQAMQAGLAGAAPMAYAGAMPIMPGQIGGQQIGQYMSPYLGSVVGTTMAAQAQQNAQQRAAMQGQAIQQGAFGGDRAGIAQANLAYQQNLANAQTLANLMNQGYGQALQTAVGQQGVNLAAQQANRQALQQQAQNLYGMYGGYGQALAGLGTGAQQAALQGAQAQLAAGQAQQQTGQAGLAAMYNQFQQQQSYPFQVAQFLANIAMGTGALSGSTTTTTQPAPFFSDRRLKHDVHQIGKTNDGLPIYSFKYNGDDRTQIGLMAQDVEKKHPEAVGLAGGYKTVDYEKATKGAHKSYGGGLSSMGGAVGLEHAGLGFERGGYAPGGGLGGGLVTPEEARNFLQAQKEAYKNLPYADMGFNIQGTPHGGVKGRVPSGFIPQTSLVTPKQQVKPQPTGMQQLTDAMSTGEKMAGWYDKAEKGVDWVRGQTGLSASNPQNQTDTSFPTPPAYEPPPVEDPNNPVKNYRGGLVRARADGGEIFDEKDLGKEAQKDSEINFPEDTTPDKASYGEIFSGSLDIPTGSGSQTKGLSPAQPSPFTSPNALQDIASIGKTIALFANRGGAIPRHGYQTAGTVTEDESSPWGDWQSPGLGGLSEAERNQERAMYGTRGRPRQAFEGSYPTVEDRGINTASPMTAGLAGGVPEPAPEFRGEAAGMTPSLGQRAEGLAAGVRPVEPSTSQNWIRTVPNEQPKNVVRSLIAPNLSGTPREYRRPEGVSYSEIPLNTFDRPGLAEKPDVVGEISSDLLRTFFPKETGVEFTPATLPEFRGEASGLEPPRGFRISNQGVSTPGGLTPASVSDGSPIFGPAAELAGGASGLVPPAPPATAAQPPAAPTAGAPAGAAAATAGLAGGAQPPAVTGYTEPRAQPTVTILPGSARPGTVGQVAPDSVTLRPGATLWPNLVSSESRGRSGIQNSMGYSGLVQFGAPLLTGTGSYTPGEGENVNDPKARGGWSGNKWSGEFHIPGHPDVKTINDFLRNPEAQRTAYDIAMAANDKVLRESGAYDLIGQTVHGVPITRDGLLKGAWLGGTQGVLNWIKTGEDRSDGSTRISEYVRSGAQAGAEGQQGEPPVRGGVLGPRAGGLGEVVNRAATSGTPEANALDEAARRRGVAGVAPDATPQERGSWMQRNREWVLPLLQFLGGMASSQSRYFLGAALSGLTGAAQGMVGAERLGQEQQKIDISQQNALVSQNASLQNVLSVLRQNHSIAIRQRNFDLANNYAQQINNITDMMSANLRKIEAITGGAPPPVAGSPSISLLPGARAAGSIEPSTPPGAAPVQPSVAGGPSEAPAAPAATAPGVATPQAVPADPAQKAMQAAYPDAVLESDPRAQDAPLIITSAGRLMPNPRVEARLWDQVDDNWNIKQLQADRATPGLSEREMNWFDNQIKEAKNELNTTGRLPGKNQQFVEFPAFAAMQRAQKSEADNAPFLARVAAEQSALDQRRVDLKHTAEQFRSLQPGAITQLVVQVSKYANAFLPAGEQIDLRGINNATAADTLTKLIATLQNSSSGMTDLGKQLEGMKVARPDMQAGAARNVLSYMIGQTQYNYDKNNFVSRILRSNMSIPQSVVEDQFREEPGRNMNDYIARAYAENPVRGQRIDANARPGYQYILEASDASERFRKPYKTPVVVRIDSIKNGTPMISRVSGGE